VTNGTQACALTHLHTSSAHASTHLHTSTPRASPSPLQVGLKMSAGDDKLERYIIEFYSKSVK